MFRKHVLDSGLTVLTEHMPHVRSVAVGVWLKRGSRHELAEESGLAHFIEHMVFKGTDRRSQAEIAQEMDAIGGQTDAFTSHEYSGFHATVLDENLTHAVDLLADIVLAPKFDAEELERERNVIFEEIKSVEDAPEDLVHDMFVESFWPNHPLGRPILGTPDTVAGFGRDDLRAFFKKNYAPSNLIVAAAGHVDLDAFEALVEAHFGSLKSPATAVREVAPPVDATIRLREKDLEQAHLVLGTIAPAEAADERFAVYLLNAVLGGNLSSRLFQVIREERGLAYNVYSGLGCFRDAGQFTVYAGCDPKNIASVVELVLHELKRIRLEPVGDAELQRAKDHLKGSILLGLESSGSRMSRMARQEMYFGRQIAAEDVVKKLEAVRPEQLLRLAEEMFGGRPLAMTLLGRLEHFDPVPETLVA